MKNREAFVTNILGIAMFYGHKYEEAESYWKDALTLYEKLGKVAAGISVKSNLTRVLWQTDRQQESITLTEEVVRDLDKLRGSDHPESLMNLRMLADRRYYFGDLPGAIAEYRRHAEITRRKYGPENEKTARAMLGLSMALRFAGESGEALHAVIDRRLSRLDTWFTVKSTLVPFHYCPLPLS